MCGLFSQIVRVQSKNGTKRIQAEPSHTLQRFLEKVRVSCGVRGPSLVACISVQVISEFQLRSSDTFSLYRSPGLKDELTRSHLVLQLQRIPLRYCSWPLL